MRFWLDAQLPPHVAVWLQTEFALDAVSLRDVGLRDANDGAIFRAAQMPGMVIVGKDSDFVDLLSRYGTPPQLLWVTCGNVANRRLQEVLSITLSEALTLLGDGQAIVEVAG